MSDLANSLNTKKFAFILSGALIVLSVIPILIYYVIPGNNGSDAAIANNGIRLVKDLQLEERPDVGFGLSSNIPNIRVNDMFLGTDNNLHKVTQIRLAQDGSYFILHKTKKISRYSSFRELVSDNFQNPKIENVLTFVENKRKIDYPEIQSMFEQLQLANMKMRERRVITDHQYEDVEVYAAMERRPQVDPVAAAVAPPVSPPPPENVHIIDDVELATIIAQDSETATDIEIQEFEKAEVVEYVEVQ